ncbi:hypothetical protein [Streptomyces sp. NRRL B-1347]|uniref:hypothetical protein n=1 Tax=Streptomyces sp. NRRL B-1347 TaxID=1476877 RepID=UPI000AFE5608|nr:hypothetical protein [Streptomyces sp. NRRL B-1347]
MLDRLGIESHLVLDSSGSPVVALSEAGMRQLGAWFADHGDAAQAAAIHRALDA